MTARQRRSAVRSAGCHAARRMGAALHGALAIVVRFAGLFIYRARVKRAEAAKAAAWAARIAHLDEMAKVEMAKARAAAVLFERRLAARVEATARKAARTAADERADDEMPAADGVPAAADTQAAVAAVTIATGGSSKRAQRRDHPYRKG